MIFKIQRYVNHGNKSVEEKTPLDPKYDKHYHRFMGTGVVNINTPHGVEQGAFEFPIEANSIEEAFVKFDNSADAFIDNIKKEEQKNILITNKIPKNKPGLIL